MIKADKFPATHPIIRKQNVRIISLLPDQKFLDQLYKFPANYAFEVGLCKRLYIRGGSRIDPKDPTAKKAARRPRFGKAAIAKLLLDNNKEITKRGEEEQDVAEIMGQASILSNASPPSLACRPPTSAHPHTFKLDEAM